jgi:two-component system sensor histidine kinase KdpD
VVYIQTDKEKADKIDPAVQRHLLNNFKLAAELGAEVVEIGSNEIANSIVDFARQKEASLIVIGKPVFSILYRLKPKNLFRTLASKAAQENIDILLISPNENHKK